MAVRFDASTDRLLRTSDLIDYNAAYTWMAYIQIVVDTNAVATFWTANDNSANNVEQVRGDSTGTVLEIRVINAGAATSVAGTNLTVGQWYHVAVVRESATSIKAYLDGVLDITNTRDVTGRAAPTRMEHGAFRTSNTQASNSLVQSIKIWSTALTLDEINQERSVIRPVRFANLYGFWPCFPGATERLRDYSGNGRDWTESGTLTDEDPPSLAWGAPSIWLPFAAASGATYTEAGEGDVITVASGADTQAVTEAGQATSVATASGADTQAVTEAGQATSVATASGADVLVLTEAGQATSELTASGADAWAMIDTGQATSELTASVADDQAMAEASEGDLGMVAAGLDSFNGTNTYIEAGQATSEATASGADTLVSSDAGQATGTWAGSAADGLVLTDAGQVTSIFTAGGADIWAMDDAGQALSAWSSGVLDTMTMIDAGGGVLIAVASGDDGTLPVVLLPYQGEMTTYDAAGATGSISGATVLASDAVYDTAGATGSTSGATVLASDTAYDSAGATGSTSGATLLPSETSY